MATVISGLYLDIGAGDRPYTDGVHEWVHLDERLLPDIEFIGQADDVLNVVGPASCKGIMARHILEHFSFRDTVKVLQNWKAALEQGGEIQIEVPNFAWQTKSHAFGQISDEEAVEYAYGSQDYEGNFHKAAFTPALLEKKLKEAGFADVVTQDVGQVVVAYARVRD